MSIVFEDFSKVTGESTISNLKTAINHFNNFLLADSLNLDNFSSWHQLPRTSKMSEILGRFSDYLINYVPTVKMYTYHKNLVSSLSVNFSDRFPETKESLAASMSKLQLNLRKIYKSDNIAKGTSLIKHSILPKYTDYLYICRRLFDNNMYLERSVVTMDTHCGGRINEANDLMKQHVIVNDDYKYILYYSVTHFILLSHTFYITQSYILYYSVIHFILLSHTFYITQSYILYYPVICYLNLPE
jgi:hypothetical protein